MTASVNLPWPDARLSPNARLHWSQAARVKKAAKRAAFYLTVEAGLKNIGAESLDARITFFPPDHRARDLDNTLASLKAAIDGVSQAVGIDDSKWVIALRPFGPVEKNGRVEIKLSWQQVAA